MSLPKARTDREDVYRPSRIDRWIPGAQRPRPHCSEEDRSDEDTARLLRSRRELVLLRSGCAGEAQNRQAAVAVEEAHA